MGASVPPQAPKQDQHDLQGRHHPVQRQAELFLTACLVTGRTAEVDTGSRDDAGPPVRCARRAGRMQRGAWQTKTRTGSAPEGTRPPDGGRQPRAGAEPVAVWYGRSRPPPTHHSVTTAPDGLFVPDPDLGQKQPPGSWPPGPANRGTFGPRPPSAPSDWACRSCLPGRSLVRAQLGPHRLPVTFPEQPVGSGTVRRKVPRAAHLVHVAVQQAHDPALDRLALLPKQQLLGVGGEGGRLVTAREQGLKTVQAGLQESRAGSWSSRPSQFNCGTGAVSAAMTALRGMNQTPATYQATSRCSDSYVEHAPYGRL